MHTPKHLLIAYYVCVRGQGELRWKYIDNRTPALKELPMYCEDKACIHEKLISNNYPSRIRGKHTHKNMCRDIYHSIIYKSENVDPT